MQERLDPSPGCAHAANGLKTVSEGMFPGLESAIRPHRTDSDSIWRGVPDSGLQSATPVFSFPDPRGKT